ncbi:hypothetical protein FTO74_08980 [Granulicella sp. WH15]|uniref:hypothetical protein n=1 Tax=Granulicella sp. WH15 TaxID=2602070 RepID=UPI001366E2D7|nr:hypothetical protein FTO74_08980 [Granulicella sp. WH15]
MTFDDQKVNTSDDSPEMVRILEEMIAADVTITARAVARMHSTVKHASSIIRHSARSSLMAQYQERQKQFRAMRGRMPKRSLDQIAAQIVQKDARIAELERRVEILSVSHLAMMRAVGELGGISKWLKLYANHREIRDELNKMGMLPKTDVKQFQMPKPEGIDDPN